MTREGPGTGMHFSRDVVIVGGCGRVGLPLGLAFADAGLSVTLYDRDARAVDLVRSAKMPFRERGADELLERMIDSGRLAATTESRAVGESEHVMIVVGTPVDEHLNPNPSFVLNVVEGLLDQLRDGQHLVLRSTVYPGVTRMIERLLVAAHRTIDVSFCPERIAEGHALEELHTLPQIISARTERAAKRADQLFSVLAPSLIRLEPEEAEVAKLFTNTWRYIKFAAANQMFMIANDFGLDFARIRAALKQDYPRAADMPGPGLAAGPCLLKDTMQLAAFNNNNFTLGHASMMINEGLPMYIVARLEREYELSSMTVGILGMSFKAESDDTRDSLSYKLKRLLRFRAARVLCTDPYVEGDRELWPLDDVLAESDLLVIATPHATYAGLDGTTPVVDIWNLLGNGERV
ncbi:MAG TPA: nucleotide sugar dehydrogenase [Acidimicrobiia bacterium]|nr:nucleotide sugar dehydrogenase [Acidimicrobiia bacterium]